MTRSGAPLYAAIEAGGTKFVCAVGTHPNEITAVERIATTSPVETLGLVSAFFEQASQSSGRLRSMGIGSFGPVDIDRSSAEFGKIRATPKPGWSNVNIADELIKRLDLPVSVDTDVNCALLGEASFGAGRDFKDLVYITIGTGIGGGIMSEGKVLYGTSHPEIGHMLMRREPDDVEFAGVCPYHGADCIEGLASGPAIQARWNVDTHDLHEDHPAWDLQARYLAGLCHNVLLMLAPQRIVLGGGVMSQSHLFPLIRDKLYTQIQGYGAVPHSREDLEKLIVPSQLGGQAGIMGAMQLAIDKSPVTSS